MYGLQGECRVIKILLRLFVVVVVGIFLLMLYRPEFVTNASNALLNNNKGTVVGSAQFLPNLQGKGSDLQLSLQGLTSSLHYVVTLNQGSCTGKVLATIGSITADQQGNAVATLEKTDLNAALTQGVWVNVHQGSANGTSVACGRVQTNSAVATAQSNTGVPVASSTTVNNTTTGVTPLLPATSNQSSSNGVNGFPQTGVAPAKENSYRNYTFPRKY
jgi:hypothetical protein